MLSQEVAQGCNVANSSRIAEGGSEKIVMRIVRDMQDLWTSLIFEVEGLRLQKRSVHSRGLSMGLGFHVILTSKIRAVPIDMRCIKKRRATHLK